MTLEAFEAGILASLVAGTLPTPVPVGPNQGIRGYGSPAGGWPREIRSMDVTVPAIPAASDPGPSLPW
jgi:hypothetical protein